MEKQITTDTMTDSEIDCLFSSLSVFNRLCCKVIVSLMKFLLWLLELIILKRGYHDKTNEDG